MSASDRSIPLPVFNGKEESYTVWKAKIEGFAQVKGIWKAIQNKSALPVTEATGGDADVESTIKANALLMAYLLNAFSKDSDVQIVMSTKSTEWPSGVAHKVFEKLDKKYQPKDIQTDVERDAKLLSVKMNRDENPDTLFEQVAAIGNWYDNGAKKVEESTKIAIVLAKAPVEYKSIIATTMASKGSALKLDDLQDVMKKYWRSKYSETGKSEKDEEDELNLSTMRFKGTCNHCGKHGHKAVDCWDDPKNADKRPEWMKKKEVAAIGVKSRELQL